MSNTRTVTTQQDLDRALRDEVEIITIDSPHGVWLTVSAYDSATVSASGSATVRAYGSATVSAYDSATVSASGSATVSAYGSATVSAYDSATVSASGSATVRAYGSATVRAYDSATVSASGSATVSAYGSATVSAYDSATVSAYDSATVSAYDSATVRAYDSATVRAYDSATVSAYDSATVSAYDSATVSAYDSATVRAYDSATVSASPRVAIHIHAAQVTVQGGVQIIQWDEPFDDPAAWCAWHGIAVEDDIATVYKAVTDGWTTWRGTSYSPGETPEAVDWKADGKCGRGLHFCPRPDQAARYYEDGGPPQFVAVGVRLDEISPIRSDGGTPKLKARRVVVPCRPVDIDGNPIAA